MNLKFKIFTLLLIFFSFACKEDKKETPIKTATEETAQKQPNKLVFEIDLTTTQPDEFIFFANNIFLNNNQFMNINIIQKLHINETEKKVRFELPDNIEPESQVGLILGRKLVKSVIVKGIMVSYGEIKFNINPNELHKYFTFSRFIEYKPETGELITNKVDGKFNPTMLLKTKLLKKLY